jgi:galactose mutarotase-like enzyme
MAQELTIANFGWTAAVNPRNGQLVSLSLGGVEYFHGGGKSGYAGPGWKNSEIVPFPIFGPADNLHVVVGDARFPLEQHGISRHTGQNPFHLLEQERHKLTFRQVYDGGPISNPHFTPGNGHPEDLFWLPYTLEKTFELRDVGLQCTLTVTNDSERDMPYVIGWHPAFPVMGDVAKGQFYLYGNRANVSLDLVIDASLSARSAIEFEGCDSVLYWNEAARDGVNVTSQGLPHVVLWSPGRDSGMFCIEPVSNLPTPGGKGYFQDPSPFESLPPGKTKTYRIIIQSAGQG